MPRTEAGQATIEWSALLLVVALALGALGYAATRAGAWRLGDAIVDAVICAAGDGCPDELERAYGKELAGTVRRYAPNVVYERSSAQLPVDFRRCREAACANGPDGAGSIAESDLGLPVTAFTRVIDRRDEGGALYVHYWLYYPDSFTGRIGRKLGPLARKWPGYHPDDWETYQVRIGPGDLISARASAHGGYKNFKHLDGWGPWSGWYRVSGGSHAGHLVAGPTGERTTPASSLRLVPLERLTATDVYRFAVSPPWRKPVYRHPELGSS
jgi:hypothetical protein